MFDIGYTHSCDNVNCYGQQLGEGFFSNMIDKAKDQAKELTQRKYPGYPGELHAPLILESGKIGIANYAGAGTHVVKRLIRGDPPRTLVDKVAKRHDIDYIL
jgi:hypothetical protein